MIVWILIFFFVVLEVDFFYDSDSFLNQNKWIFFVLAVPFSIKINSNLKVDQEDFKGILEDINEQKLTSKGFLQLYEALLTLLKSQSSMSTTDSRRGHCKVVYTHFWKMVVFEHRKVCQKAFCSCRESEELHIQDFYKFVRLAVHITDLHFQEQLNKSKQQYGGLLELYINFLIDIKGDYLKPRRYLGNNNGRLKLGSLDAYLYRLKLKVAIQQYSQWRSFRKPFLETEPKRKLSLENEFLKIFQNYYQNILMSQRMSIKLIKIRKNFFKKCLTIRSYTSLFNSSTSFARISDSLRNKLRYLEGLTRRRNQSVIMLKMFYESRIEDNPKQVRMTLKRLKEGYATENLNHLFLRKALNESLVVFVGNEEKNEHQISMVSGRSKALVGYEKLELEGQDLDLIMPKHLKKTHRCFFGKVNYFFGRLEDERKIEEYCLTKGGGLKDVQIYIKAAYFKGLGLQYIGLILFPKLDSMEIDKQILVDKDGDILGINNCSSRNGLKSMKNHGLRRLVDCETVNQISPHLQGTLDLLTLFYVGYSQNGNFPEFDINAVISNDVDSLLWEIFLKWKYPQKAQLYNSKGKSTGYMVSIHNRCFGKGDEFYFYWLVNIYKKNNQFEKEQNLARSKIQSREKRLKVTQQLSTYTESSDFGSSSHHALMKYQVSKYRNLSHIDLENQLKTIFHYSDRKNFVRMHNIPAINKNKVGPGGSSKHSKSPSIYGDSILHAIRPKNILRHVKTSKLLSSYASVGLDKEKLSMQKLATAGGGSDLYQSNFMNMGQIEKFQNITNK